jgi:hypothetical protein
MVLLDEARGFVDLCIVECSDLMQDTNPTVPMVSYAVCKMR